MSMVSISKSAPDSSRMCSVAAMISGPMPSPCATVMGVLDMIPWRLSQDCSSQESEEYKRKAEGRQLGQSAQGRIVFNPCANYRFSSYLARLGSCSRAAMVHAPVRDRESDDVRLRRE